MAKIILHIGISKTASTTLQDIFFNNLDKKKINFLGKKNYFQAIKNKKTETFFNILQDLLWKDNFRNRFSTYQTQFNSLLVENQINLISEEVLFNSDNIRNLIPFKERLQRMESLLKGHSVRVFCVIRKQSEQLYVRYIQNYANQWYYTKNQNTPDKYYKYLLSHQDKENEMLNYVPSLEAYKKAFGNIHCFFFEELLENEFAFYQKIALFLKIKITEEDIPIQRLNVKEKKSKGYLLKLPKQPNINIKKHYPVRYKFYFHFFVKKIFYLFSKTLNTLFVNYNIFLSLSKKKKIYGKIMKMGDVFFRFFLYRKICIPYFSKEQKQTIHRVSIKYNNNLVKKGLCSEKELKKYGYL